MHGKICGRVIKSLIVTGLTTLGAAGHAHAGLTHVNAPKHATELGHGEILSQTYGGTFAASGAGYTNGNVTAERLDDAGSVGGTTTSLLAKGAVKSDQCWADGVLSIRAIARFGGYEQSLGILAGETGGSFQKLFGVSGTGLDVSGSVDGLDLCGSTFRFARGGGGELFTSLDLDNAGAADQMVSYRLSGPNGLEKYVLFFEDVGASQDSDWDFNDLVVEITAGGPNAIPLPPAVWTGLAIMVTGGLVRSRKRLAALAR